MPKDKNNARATTLHTVRFFIETSSTDRRLSYDNNRILELPAVLEYERRRRCSMRLRSFVVYVRTLLRIQSGTPATPHAAHKRFPYFAVASRRLCTKNRGRS